MLQTTKRKETRFLTRLDIIILAIVVGLLISLGLVVKLVLQQDKYVTVEMLATGGEWWWGVPPPYYWNAKNFQIGAKEYDSFHKPIVEVIDTVKYNEDNRSFLWIKARLLVKYNVVTKQYVFRQETLGIGNTIHIAPDNIMFIGNVVGIEGVGSMWDPEYVTVTGRAKDIQPWEAESLAVGDKVVDNKGALIAEITNTDVELADMVATTYTGEVLQRKNPLVRDVKLTMKMRVMKNGNSRFFNYFQPVDVGSKVRIQFPKQAIEINVMSINPVK